MATGAKINIKNIDYFKFKKIVIDGNRDDYGGCSREVKSLCDCVQTLSFRDDEFDDVSDRPRFDEVISSYRQILASKRIEPTDMRIKNGWWVDANAGNVCSAGKFKPGALKETLVTKTKDWIGRHGPTADLKSENVVDKIEGPGLYIFKHKEHQCFQYVGKADKIFNRCAEKMKAAFDGTLNEPLAALLVISMASDWEFYFIPVQPNDGADILRILENDVILRHDCIWPHGLNFSLHIDSLLEVSEFRKSCLRHHWPPENDVVDEAEVSLDRLRRIEKTSPRGPDEETGSGEESLNGGGTVRVDSKPQSEGSSNGKTLTPTENGHPTSSNGHPPTNATQPPVQKTSAAPTTTKQPPSAAPPRRIARPASAPKPPALKQSNNPTSRPKSPGLSKETTRRLDAVHRSLDAEDHRGPRAKSSGTGTRRTLERPRSSLDARPEARVSPPEDQTTRNEEEGKGGMTRSKSVSSTTSIDSKKERTPVATERVKSVAAKESVVKASGIKAPAVQVTNRRRPPTAKPKATNAAEITQEVSSS